MKRSVWSVVVLAAAVGAGGVVSAAAQEQAKEPVTNDEVKASVPQTAEEHMARAESYKAKAVEYRAEAAMHRKMFADYKRTRSSPSLESKTGREMSWVTKMRKHCDAYIVDAEKLAAEADRFAEFHRMRAEEMKGK